MPKAVKEWAAPAFVLTLVATLFAVGGAAGVTRWQASQIDSKADKIAVEQALSRNELRDDKQDLRLDRLDGQYRDILVEVRERLGRIETKLDGRRVGNP